VGAASITIDSVKAVNVTRNTDCKLMQSTDWLSSVLSLPITPEARNITLFYTGSSTSLTEQ